MWFQRASDVVRRLRAGDVDIGILGNDMYTEFGEVSEVISVVNSYDLNGVSDVVVKLSKRDRCLQAFLGF